MIFGTSLMKSWQIELGMPLGHSSADYIAATYESQTRKVTNVKVIFILFYCKSPDLDFVP